VKFFLTLISNSIFGKQNCSNLIDQHAKLV